MNVEPAARSFMIPPAFRAAPDLLRVPTSDAAAAFAAMGQPRRAAGPLPAPLAAGSRRPAEPPPGPMFTFHPDCPRSSAPHYFLGGLSLPSSCLIPVICFPFTPNHETATLLPQLPSLTQIDRWTTCAQFDWLCGLPNLTDVSLRLAFGPANRASLRRPSSSFRGDRPLSPHPDLSPSRPPLSDCAAPRRGLPPAHRPQRPSSGSRAAAIPTRQQLGPIIEAALEAAAACSEVPIRGGRDLSRRAADSRQSGCGSSRMAAVHGTGRKRRNAAQSEVLPTTAWPPSCTRPAAHSARFPLTALDPAATRHVSTRHLHPQCPALSQFPLRSLPLSVRWPTPPPAQCPRPPPSPRPARSLNEREPAAQTQSSIVCTRDTLVPTPKATARLIQPPVPLQMPMRRRTAHPPPPPPSPSTATRSRAFSRF